MKRLSKKANGFLGLTAFFITAQFVFFYWTGQHPINHIVYAILELSLASMTVIMAQCCMRVFR